MKLGDLLIAEGLVSGEQLSQALQVQNQHGGRLGSNLLELGFITEQQLAMALSRQLGVPCVQVEQVEKIPADVIATLSKDLAQEYRAVPFVLNGRTLSVCLSDPRNLEKVDELAFRLSYSVKPFVIAEIALDYALHRYYGLPRQTRFLKIANAAAPTGGFVQLSESIEPKAGNAGGMNRANFLEHDKNALFVGQEAEEQPIPRLVQEMANVRSLNEIKRYVAQFTGAVFPHSFVLEIQGEHANGFSASGLEISNVDAARIHVPLTEGSLLRELLGNARVIHRAQADDASLTHLCASIGMKPHCLTVLPAFTEHRVFLIAVGQGLPVEQLQAYFPRIRHFLARVSWALQILDLRQKILAPESRPE